MINTHSLERFFDSLDACMESRIHTSKNKNKMCDVSIGKGIKSSQGNTQRKGLRVALWGPIMWSFLHGVGALAQPKDAKLVGSLLRALGPLLPCKMCSDDYPTILAQVEARRGQTAAEACAAGEAFAFMYDIHAGVNRKLAMQRFEKNDGSLVNILRKNLSSSSDATQVVRAATIQKASLVELLENGPSLEVVQSRYALLAGKELWSTDAHWILLLLIARRLNTALVAKFLTLLWASAVFSDRMGTQGAQDAATTLRACFRLAREAQPLSDSARRIEKILTTAYLGANSENASDCLALSMRLQTAVAKGAVTCPL